MPLSFSPTSLCVAAGLVIATLASSRACAQPFRPTGRQATYSVEGETVAVNFISESAGVCIRQNAKTGVTDGLILTLLQSGRTNDDEAVAAWLSVAKQQNSSATYRSVRIVNGREVTSLAKIELVGSSFTNQTGYSHPTAEILYTLYATTGVLINQRMVSVALPTSAEDFYIMVRNSKTNRSTDIGKSSPGWREVELLRLEKY